MAETTPSPAPAEDRLKKVFDALWSDSKVGAEVRAKTKELYPDVVTPEDTIDPLLSPLKAQIEEMSATIKKEREERDAERATELETRQAATMRSQLDAARDKFNLTDDGLDKMVSRMKETGNYTDAEAAAAWVVQQTPPVPVSKASYLPKKLNLFGSSQESQEADFRLLHTDPLAYQDQELEKFVNDPDAYVRETFAA